MNPCKLWQRVKKKIFQLQNDNNGNIRQKVIEEWDFTCSSETILPSNLLNMLLKSIRPYGTYHNTDENENITTKEIMEKYSVWAKG